MSVIDMLFCGWSLHLSYKCQLEVSLMVFWVANMAVSDELSVVYGG